MVNKLGLIRRLYDALDRVDTDYYTIISRGVDAGTIDITEMEEIDDLLIEVEAYLKDTENCAE